MKKSFMLFVMLLMVTWCIGAYAEGAAGITAALDAAGIQQPVQLSQWGDTAACFAETDGVKRLIVLEKHEEVWQIVIDNPTALMQDHDWPQLLLDSDNALFWAYLLSDQAVVRYHSTRNA